ncbi:MAG: PP2C family protein-serine/threonine phosphatase [Candidatus Brocadiae bacterium]|nr:PP2C family protein-serine/threonine phosphatase [Candidatus Brocadiia bacterium]
MAKSDRQQAKAWAFEQAIKRRVVRDRGWRVLVHGRDWLCPYCGEVGVSPFRERQGPRDVLRHFVDECSQWAEDAAPRYNHVDLAARAERLERIEALRTDPAWRLADALGRWACPFCAEAAMLQWPVADRDAAVPIEAVDRHLKRCQPCQDKRKPMAAEALRLVVKDANELRALTATMRLRIEADPAWRQADGEGRWICPECHQAVPEVDVSSDLLLASLAPGRMARHVMERCGKQAAPEQAMARPKADETSERDLKRARQIVQKMLPADVPHVEGFGLHCLYRPTESVGGDFYDYFALSDHEMAFLIGDVSGHGLEAALIMTRVKKSLKLHAQTHRSPAEVLRRTNLDINADLDGRTFVTASYAVLDARGGSLVFARAGHNKPILFNPRRNPPIRHLESKGMALGMYQGGLFDQLIQETELRIGPGDVFLLYTDGLTEARNPAGESYGLDRLEAAVSRSHGDFTSQGLADRLLLDAQAFAGDAPQDDDIAILCLTCTRR